MAQALVLALDLAMENMRKVKERKEQRVEEVVEVEQLPLLVMVEGHPLQRVILIPNSKARILA